jgi:hypothetical protein
MSASRKENNSTQSISNTSLGDGNKKNYCIDYHGATFINRVGQEVAITEDMVEEACQQFLIDSPSTPRSA